MSTVDPIEYALELTRRSPNEHSVWLNLSGAYLRVKSIKEALAASSQAIRLAPHMEEVWLNRAKLHIQIGDPSAAEDDYTQAIVLYDVHQNKAALYSTLSRRAYSRSLIGDFQGAVDDLLLVKKNNSLEKQDIDLFNYCSAMLEQD